LNPAFFNFFFYHVLSRHFLFLFKKSKILVIGVPIYGEKMQEKSVLNRKNDDIICFDLSNFVISLVSLHLTIH